MFNLISNPTKPPIRLPQCDTALTILFIAEKASGYNSGNCFLWLDFSSFKCCALPHTNGSINRLSEILWIPLNTD